MLGVICPTDASAGVDANHAAMALNSFSKYVYGGSCGAHGVLSAPHEIPRGAGHENFHEVFADAGGGGGADGIVGNRACADEGRIADASGVLIGSAAGGGRGGQVASTVEGYGADGALARAA